VSDISEFNEEVLEETRSQARQRPKFVVGIKPLNVEVVHISCRHIRTNGKMKRNVQICSVMFRDCPIMQALPMHVVRKSIHVCIHSEALRFKVKSKIVVDKRIEVCRRNSTRFLK